MTLLYPGNNVFPGTQPEALEPYFTVAELRARYPELVEATYSDDAVQDAIDLAIEAFEDAADVAFIPRSKTLTLVGDTSGRLLLPVSRVTSVDTVSGSSTGTIDVSTGQLVGGTVFLASGWTSSETLTVTVTHGYEAAPLRVVRAVMLLARTWLIRGPVDDRATQIPSADGGVINLSTPGLFGSTFGIPEVDATLQQYRHHALVP